MSVIQNLRTKYAKIVGGLIGVSLVGFILMDASNGPLQSLFGRDTSVARVNGNKIDAKEYQQVLADYELLVPLYSKGKPLDEATRAQIRQQVLDEMVYQKLIEGDVERLGITVTDAELKDLIRGSNPDPMVQQFPYFADQKTGQFNPQMIAAFEQQVPQLEPSQREKLQAEWAALQRFVARSRKLQKFNSLVLNGVYMPAAFAKKATEAGSEMASVRFVKLPFTLIPDAEVKVTDADLNSYLREHKDQYTIDAPVRSMDYVTFDVVPSTEDTSKSLGTLRNLRNEFASTNDVESFINRNSEVPYNSRYFTKKMFAQAPGSDSLLNYPVGSVIGPYYENGAYQMVRVMEKKEMPDSVKAQHILLAAKEGRDDSASHKLADSLVGLLKSGMPFDTLAKRFSDDQSNKDKGGDLGTFGQGQMVPEFNDVAFEGKTGDLKTVKTQFGWHILKINEQKGFQTATKLVAVVKSLQPSQTTNDAAYTRAVSFAGKNKDAKAFEKAVIAERLQQKVAENIRQNDFSINGLGSSRELIGWVWGEDRKLGDVSDPFNIDGRYVVAKVSGIKEAGLMTLDESNKPQIEQLVKARKKGDLLLSRYGKMKTLEEVAAASKQVVMQADSFSFANPFAKNLGFEPKVVGYAFNKAFKEGTTSPAIRGNDGVYITSLTQRFTTALPPMDAKMLKEQQMSQAMQIKQGLNNALQQTMRRNAKITYNTKML